MKRCDRFIFGAFYFFLSVSLAQEGAIHHRLMGIAQGGSCPTRELYWDVSTADEKNPLLIEPPAALSPRLASVTLKVSEPVCEDTPVRIHVGGGNAMAGTFYSSLPDPTAKDGLVSKTLLIPKGSDSVSFSFKELFSATFNSSAFQWLSVHGGGSSRQWLIPSGNQVIQRAGLWRDVQFDERLGLPKIHGFVVGGRRDISGSGHTVFHCILGQSGRVSCWGEDGFGQLGDGGSPNQSKFVPQAVQQNSGGSFIGYRTISGKWKHACAIDFNNQVWCWGYNLYGRLGLGDTSQRDAPVQVSSFSAKFLESGYFHTCAISSASGSDNQVFCWGRNNKGQLGIGSTTDQYSPQQITGYGAGAGMISSGGYHTCAVSTDQKLLCWGDHSKGQLGLSSLWSRSGCSEGFGLNSCHSPQQVDYNNYKFVSAGFEHTCAISSTDKLFCWGSNSQGQVGNGSGANVTTPTVIQDDLNFQMVSAGYDHTCAITTDGKLYCWGSDQFGKLGNGSSGNSSTPVLIDGTEKYHWVQAGTNATCAMTTQGVLKCWGMDDYNMTLSRSISSKSLQDIYVPQALPAIEAQAYLTSGLHHACSLGRDWQLRCWGYGGQGQLGLGSNSSVASPERVVAPSEAGGFQQVSAGEEHTCALGLNHRVYCWGKNDKGQVLPASGAGASYQSPTHDDSIRTYRWVGSGAYHSCGIEQSTNAVWCWGSRQDGRLGDGQSAGSGIGKVMINSSTPANLGFIAVGYHHSCGIDVANAKLYCWGNNQHGQLGIGNTSSQAFASIVDSSNDYKKISAGERHTCALRNNDQVWCWGDNSSGQLGTGDFDSSLIPRAVNWSSVALSSGEKMVELSLGKEHSCALSNQGRIYCWGSGYYGALGIGGTASSGFPRRVDSNKKFIALAAGGYHTCARDEELNTYCWGKNDQGQLGVGTFYRKELPYSVDAGFSYQDTFAGASSTCVLDENKRAKCFGDNSYGQLGNGHENSLGVLGFMRKNVVWKKIAMGRSHACGISVNGGLYCWGLNLRGQLGVSQKLNTYEPVLEPVPVDGIERYQDISVGDEDGNSGYSCAVTQSGAVKCWGDNTNSRLGHASTEDVVNTPTVVLASGYQSVVAGDGHICALSNSGQVSCWGRNQDGQLGRGTSSSMENSPLTLPSLSNIVLLSAGGRSTCAANSAGKIWCWGANPEGKLGLGSAVGSSVLNPTEVAVSGLTQVRAISLGLSHMCIIDQNDKLRCAGSNTSGQLGVGASIPSRDTLQPVDDTQSYKAISLGDYHTCALRSSGELVCWGDNFVGQIGLPIVDRPLVQGN